MRPHTCFALAALCLFATVAVVRGQINQADSDDVQKLLYCEDYKLLTDPAGNIFSNIGGDYQSSRSCAWDIPVGRKFDVRLKFRHFDLENGFDTVKIYLPGANYSAPPYRTFTGFNAEDVNYIHNDQNAGHIRILFESDCSSTRRGFMLRYKIENYKSELVSAYEPTPFEAPEVPVIATSTGSCYSTTGLSELDSLNAGQITSNTDWRYTPNSNCYWSFNYDPSTYSSFTINFNRLDLEKGQDFLFIDVPGMEKPMHFTGNDRPKGPLTFKPDVEGTFKFTFTSDCSGNRKGFDIDYAAIQTMVVPSPTP